jgi:hypothetical protein
MANSMQMTVNDTAPSAQGTLKSGRPKKVAVDIQGATVKFHMTDAANELKVNAAANNDQVGDGSDGSKGKVSYDWDPADVDTEGVYKAEWEVTYTDGTIQTFPTPGFNEIRFNAELA